MATIYTTYLGPTNTKGSRVKAYTASKSQSVTLGWDYELTIELNHRAAMVALVRKMHKLAGGGWLGGWVQGDAGPNGGFVFVQAISTRFGVSAAGEVR